MSEDAVVGSGETGERGEAPLAPVIDERVLEFVAVYTRFSAAQLYQAYRTAKEQVNLWNSGINALVPNDSSPIQDGNTRYPATGADVHNILNRASEFVADLEENGNAKLNTLLRIVAFGR